MGNRKQDSVSIAKHTEQKNTFPKLKGGGKKPKSLLTDDKEVELELTFLRSLDLLTEGSDHNKCELAKINAKKSLCNFCLLRSLVIRSRNPKGRTKECQVYHCPLAEMLPLPLAMGAKRHLISWMLSGQFVHMGWKVTGPA